MKTEAEKEDVEEGAEQELLEHKVSKSVAKRMAAVHEKEHPMYYKKLEAAGLGDDDNDDEDDNKAKVATMIKKRKTVTKSPSAKEKVRVTMHEFKTGTLHSGSKKGPEVTNRKQAIAIALSQARKKA